jgi:peptide/nickel transport system substrate-binding protein
MPSIRFVPHFTRDRRTWMRLVALAAVLGCTALVAACGGTPASPTGGSSAQTDHPGANKAPVTVALSTDLDVLDPQLFKNDVAIIATASLHGTLIQEKFSNVDGALKATGDYVGEIAESWKESADGKTVTFTIKPGLKFQDGSPLTADDWVYTWKRIFKGPGYISALLPIIGIESAEDIEAPDPQTLVIRRQFNSPMFMPFMASPCCFVVMSEESAKAHATKSDPWAAKWFTSNVNSSGPYVIDTWHKGQEMVLKPNPDNPLPDYVNNAGVTFKIVPSAEDRISLVRGGAIDAAQNIPFRDLDALRNDPSVHIFKSPGRRVSYVGFNVKSAPFDDVNLRRAIQQAIPYDALVERVLYGFGQPAGSVLSKGMPGYKDVLPPKQDVSAAEATLAKSSYKGQKLTLAVRQSQPQDEASAVFIQDALREIGVNVELQTIPDVRFQEQLGKKAIPFFLMDWQSLGNDGFYQLTWVARSDSPINYTAYADARMDKLIAQGIPESDPDKRAALLDQAQDIWAEQVPWAPLFQAEDVTLTSSKTAGVNNFYDPLQRPQFLYKK